MNMLMEKPKAQDPKPVQRMQLYSNATPQQPEFNHGKVDFKACLSGSRNKL